MNIKKSTFREFDERFCKVKTGNKPKKKKSLYDELTTGEPLTFDRIRELQREMMDRIPDAVFLTPNPTPRPISDRPFLVRPTPNTRVTSDRWGINSDWLLEPTPTEGDSDEGDSETM